MEKSKSEHILSLAKEIVDEIELSKTTAQAQLLKCIRLARYTEKNEIREWLNLELHGYKEKSPIRAKYITLTNRWSDKEKTKFIPVSLAEIEGTIESQKAKVQSMRVPDPSGEYGTITVNNVLDKLDSAANLVAKYEGLRSRVIGLMHKFASSIYYEKIFDNLAESIFENYKNDINELITENSGDLIEQLPHVISRLNDGDKESISQALTTCRRIIDGFTNSIFPPSDETFNIGGNDLSLKEDKVLNRLNVYIHKNSTSSSRKKRLKQNLKNLYERVCAGIHSDVSFLEAKNLFLNVYLVIGEILSLKKENH